MPALRTLKVDYDEALDAERGESCGCVLTKASRHGEPQQSPKSQHAIGYQQIYLVQDSYKYIFTRIYVQSRLPIKKMSH